jgi:hypothetical protein
MEWCTRCSEQETIQHLFFYCPLAKMTWNAISVTFNIKKPASTTNLFGPCLKSLESSVGWGGCFLLGIMAH